MATRPAGLVLKIRSRRKAITRSGTPSALAWGARWSSQIVLTAGRSR
jgi:hypothetical protein